MPPTHPNLRRRWASVPGVHFPHAHTPPKKTSKRPAKIITEIPPNYIEAEEAAAILDISARTLKKWVSLGLLHPVHVRSSAPGAHNYKNYYSSYECHALALRIEYK